MELQSLGYGTSQNELHTTSTLNLIRLSIGRSPRATNRLARADIEQEVTIVQSSRSKVQSVDEEEESRRQDGQA
jgi:hypothetical protein